MKTIIEPFKIKSVGPLGFTTRGEREEILKGAGLNLFHVPADKVLIDLLTDSGTSAMSSEQWSGMMRGDESYAGSRSYFTFEKTVKDLTGYPQVIPVHQGRAAERILFSFVGGPGQAVVSNTFFDTTRANAETSGSEVVDLPCEEALDADHPYPFKGNLNLRAFEDFIRERGGKAVSLCVLTLTNNSVGGQPASLENLRKTAQICRKHSIPLFLDAARFAENAYLIKLREPGQSQRRVREIAQEMFQLSDGCLMSAKKDALVNMGGFLGFRDARWAQKARNLLILTEGFPTYGGLSGSDLDAIAQGLQEVLDEEYLRYRIRSLAYLGEGLRRLGIPIVQPPGGHAVYVDAKRFLNHIPRELYPGQALACALYLEAGIRAVEVGSLMFTHASLELLRLAVPRRVYTQSHIDYVIEAFGELVREKASIRGIRILEAPEVLKHFSARMAWV